MRLRVVWQVVASWTFTIAFCLGASSLSLLTLGRLSRRLAPAMLRFWGRNMLRLAGVTYEVQGAEHLAVDAMKIVPFNHGSLIDAFLVTAVMPAGAVAAIKREALYYPAVGLTLYLLGFLLIDRGNSVRARATMDRAARRMASERLAVFISPEGTRQFDGELLPFKKGALHLALASGAPIVPMLIDGSFALHGPGRLTSTPGHVVIRFLPPRPSTGLTAETVGAGTEALRETYRTELARLRSERASLTGSAPAAPAPGPV